tara:strand:+ start:930 stop:1124 length:195 start_codon:yes stop_codon:yes gene_type:complete
MVGRITRLNIMVGMNIEVEHQARNIMEQTSHQTTSRTSSHITSSKEHQGIWLAWKELQGMELDG